MKFSNPNNPKLSKSYIRKYVSDKDIFEHYSGYTIKQGQLYVSPLRKDKNPTCSFFISRGNVLTMYDHSGHFTGNCFDFVCRLFNIPFSAALDLINRDLIGNRKIQVRRTTEIVIPDKNKIQFEERDWNSNDDLYWNRYGITREIRNILRIKPVRFLWLNGKFSYGYTEQCPAYAYHFTDEDIKVYFPLKTRGEGRFWCNTEYVSGYDLLPETGDIVLITKAYKDVGTLLALNVPAIAPQSEVHKMDVRIIDDLKLRFKEIYTLYDFDLTGIRAANILKRKYRIKPVFITNGRFNTKNYNAKDISDFVALGDKLDMLKNTINIWRYKK